MQVKKFKILLVEYYFLMIRLIFKVVVIINILDHKDLLPMFKRYVNSCFMVFPQL